MGSFKGCARGERGRPGDGCWVALGDLEMLGHWCEVERPSHDIVFDDDNRIISLRRKSI